MLLRDLHSGVALLFSVILLLFLLSALPWTHFWGNVVLKPVQQALGQPSPFADTLRARSTPATEATTPMTLDQAVAQARALGLQGVLEIRLDGAADAASQCNDRQEDHEIATSSRPAASSMVQILSTFIFIPVSPQNGQ